MTSDRDRDKFEPPSSNASGGKGTTRKSKEQRHKEYLQAKQELIEELEAKRDPELAKHTKVRIFLRDPDPFRMHEDLRRSQLAPEGGPKLGERYPPRKPLKYWPRRCEPMGDEIGC